MNSYLFQINKLFGGGIVTHGWHTIRKIVSSSGGFKDMIMFHTFKKG